MRLPSLVAALVLIGVASTPASAALSAKKLDESLELGRQFLRGCQRPDGSFIYEIDAVTGKDLGTRYATREMGGLWTLAALHRQTPTKDSAAAILKSLNYFGTQAKRTPTGARYLCEPTAREGATSTMALNLLAVMEFLAADYELDPAVRATQERNLADSIKFLVSLRQPGGLFATTYRSADGAGIGKPLPASDGVALLALARAAKLEGNEALRDIVIESANVMYGEYVKAALRVDPNSEAATGFYPWASMAFYELHTSGWPGTRTFAARAIVMARWMIDIRNVIDRGPVAGNAFQGLAVAWELTGITGDRKNQQYIGVAIEKGLGSLMKSQIGSSTSSGTVPSKYTKAKNVRGGVLTQPDDPKLRIDVTQNLIQAELFARVLLFRSTDTTR